MPPPDRRSFEKLGPVPPHDGIGTANPRAEEEGEPVNRIIRRSLLQISWGTPFKTQRSTCFALWRDTYWRTLNPRTRSCGQVKGGEDWESSYSDTEGGDPFGTSLSETRRGMFDYSRAWTP